LIVPVVPSECTLRLRIIGSSLAAADAQPVRRLDNVDDDVPGDPAAISKNARVHFDLARAGEEALMLIRCPECRNPVSQHATSCPRCGCPLHPEETARLLVEEQREAAHRLAEEAARVERCETENRKLRRIETIASLLAAVSAFRGRDHCARRSGQYESESCHPRRRDLLRLGYSRH